MKSAQTHWTKEKIEQLQTLWEEGLSANQIANKLGNITRNAVIGKIYRLGLSGRSRKVSPISIDIPSNFRKTEHDNFELVDKPSQQNPPSSTCRNEEPSRTYTLNPELFQEDTNPPDHPIDYKVEDCLPPENTCRRIQLIDLKVNMCRWPIGDPSSPDFYFCGNKVKKTFPYCQYHLTIGYQRHAHRKLFKKTKKETETQMS